ncbi:MAG TPA: hypothetical protein VF393_07565 [archaeon]
MHSPKRQRCDADRRSGTGQFAVMLDPGARVLNFHVEVYEDGDSVK